MPIRTVTDEAQLNDPQTLYRRWEDSQWSPFAIDLAIDQAQWPQFAVEQRELLLFALSSLMVAEERRQTLRELLPAVAASLKPPGDATTETVPDISEDDLRQFALDGLTRRLNIIGVPINTL